jgi:hypothetical protein
MQASLIARQLHCRHQCVFVFLLADDINSSLIRRKAHAQTWAMVWAWVWVWTEVQSHTCPLHCQHGFHIIFLKGRGGEKNCERV